MTDETGQTHDTEANKELVLRYMRRAQAMDPDAAKGCMAEDCVRTGPRPSSGRIEGQPQLDLYEPGSMEMEVEHILAEGPLVAVQFTIRAKTASGNPYENFYYHLFECHDGLITAQWEYLDTAYARQALEPELSARSGD